MGCRWTRKGPKIDLPTEPSAVTLQKFRRDRWPVASSLVRIDPYRRRDPLRRELTTGGVEG